MKKCSRCRIEKPLDNFSRNKARPDGLNPQCKVCAKEGYERNKHKYKEKQKVFREVNRERISAQQKERYSPERQREYSNSPKGKYSSYKSNAKQRDMSFLLTFEQFMNFWQEPCSYCGDKIETIGLDRKRNEIGYQVDNVIPCCTECNLMKRDHSYDHFLGKVRKIAEHTQK
jgi:hypothetical protein